MEGKSNLQIDHFQRESEFQNVTRKQIWQKKKIPELRHDR